jgi:hypothetical protein
MLFTVPGTVFSLWNLYFTLNICEDFTNLMNILVTEIELDVTLPMSAVGQHILSVQSCCDVSNRHHGKRPIRFRLHFHGLLPVHRP